MLCERLIATTGTVLPYGGLVDWRLSGYSVLILRRCSVSVLSICHVWICSFWTVQVTPHSTKREKNGFSHVCLYSFPVVWSRGLLHAGSVSPHDRRMRLMVVVVLWVGWWWQEVQNGCVSGCLVARRWFGTVGTLVSWNLDVEGSRCWKLYRWALLLLSPHAVFVCVDVLMCWCVLWD
jgi:hypothetical protein